MTKTVKIAGRDMQLCANALLPRKYRHAFGRDLITDMQALVKAYNAGGEQDYELFENLAWLMLKEGGEDVGATPEEWLATIDDSFEIYNIMPEVVSLWAQNQKTTARSKKK